MPLQAGKKKITDRSQQLQHISLFLKAYNFLKLLFDLVVMITSGLFKMISVNIGGIKSLQRLLRREPWEMHAQYCQATETHNPVTHQAIWRTCPVA